MLNDELAQRFERINRLKAERDAVILAHHYMPPELKVTTKQGGIADFVDDSLGLSIRAEQTTARHIVFCGVRFMAETAVLINPERKVFMPEPESGCSLAASITAADIMKLKRDYPGVPVMGYINTYAEAKTAIDICCTSRNAVPIAGTLHSSRIIFVPDMYMGQNLAEVIRARYDKELILWNGTCEVHEQFRNEAAFSGADEDTEMLMHWEVPQCAVASQLSQRKGIVGSTNDIINYVKQSSASRFFLASECDLGVQLKQEHRDKEFISPCIKCQYMKMNTLDKLEQALEAVGTPEEDHYRIALNKEVVKLARKPVLRMLQYN